MMKVSFEIVFGGHGQEDRPSVNKLVDFFATYYKVEVGSFSVSKRHTYHEDTCRVSIKIELQDLDDLCEELEKALKEKLEIDDIKVRIGRVHYIRKEARKLQSMTTFKKVLKT